MMGCDWLRASGSPKPRPTAPRPALPPVPSYFARIAEERLGPEDQVILVQVSGRGWFRRAGPPERGMASEPAGKAPAQCELLEWECRRYNHIRNRALRDACTSPRLVVRSTSPTGWWAGFGGTAPRRICGSWCAARCAAGHGCSWQVRPAAKRVTPRLRCRSRMHLSRIAAEDGLVACGLNSCPHKFPPSSFLLVTSCPPHPHSTLPHPASQATCTS